MLDIENVTATEAYRAVKKYLSTETKPGTRLCVRVKQYRPKKTNKQLGLLFLAIEHFAREALGHCTESDKRMIAAGLIEKYGYRKESMFEEDKLIPIPLSEINRFEQFDAIFNGLFIEAGELGVDMKKFVEQWEEVRRQEQELVRKVQNITGGRA